MSAASIGRSGEWLVRDVIEELGYDVIRSAASKGAADLVAINTWEVLLIAVRLRRWPPPDVRERLHKLERNPAVRTIVARVIRRRVEFGVDIDGKVMPLLGPLPIHTQQLTGILGAVSRPR